MQEESLPSDIIFRYAKAKCSPLGFTYTFTFYAVMDVRNIDTTFLHFNIPSIILAVKGWYQAYIIVIANTMVDILIASRTLTGDFVLRSVSVFSIHTCDS